MARAHHTTLPESTPPEPASHATEPAAIEVPRRRGAEPWLTVFGVLMMLAGIGLVVVPTFLPQYGWVVRSLAARGVTSLPIAIGGVLMCGIAFASRSSRASLDATASALSAARETSPVIDALGHQIATLGDGLQAIRIEFVYLKDALQSQIDRMQTTPQPQDSGAGDAVYRLAASLDQVGMRIEERFVAGHRDLGESVRALATSLETLREEHANLRSTLEELRERAPEAKVEPVEPTPEVYADEWSDKQEEEDRSARLGLLDMLDDLGRLLPAKSEEVVEDETALEPDPFAQDEGWKHAGSIPPALPRQRGEELRMASDSRNLLGQGLPRSESTSSQGLVGEKLEELRDLLADERVRQALAALERTRR
jgi:hypothetical protein